MTQDEARIISYFATYSHLVLSYLALQNSVAIVEA
jgi:hypothetical protein